jgi:hypothetical protein
MFIYQSKYPKIQLLRIAAYQARFQKKAGMSLNEVLKTAGRAVCREKQGRKKSAEDRN